MQWAEHLVAQVLVDRTAVDRLDDRAEDLPTARRVVAGRGAGLPFGRVRGDARDRLRVAHVDVVGAVVEHREAGGVGEHVTQRRPLLAARPSRRRSRRPGRRGRGGPAPRAGARATVVSGLPDEYQSITSSVRSARPGRDSPTASVEKRLTPQRHVDLGAVVPVVVRWRSGARRAVGSGARPDAMDP